MVLHMLEADDIEARMDGEHLQGSIGGLPADNYIKLYVHDDDFDKAEKIIKEFDEKNKNPINKTLKSKSNKSLLIWIALISFGSGYIFSQIPSMSSQTINIDKPDALFSNCFGGIIPKNKEK